MAIEFSEKEQIQRENLCDILGQLGGDDAGYFWSELTVEQLRSNLYSHVCWLETQAKFELLNRLLKDANLITNDESKSLLYCETKEQGNENLTQLQVRMQNMLQLAKAQMHP